MTTRITTETLIVNDQHGIPQGMIVIQATYNPDGTFVENVRHEFTVVTAQSIAASIASIASLTFSLEAANQTIETLTANAQSVTSLQSQVITLQAKVSELLPFRPFDPNVIRSEAFYRRITGDELFKLGVLASTDETARGILLLLNQYLSNAWQVVLLDQQVVDAMQYLSAVLPLTAGRVNQILRPGNRDEAFVGA